MIVLNKQRNVKQIQGFFILKIFFSVIHSFSTPVIYHLKNPHIVYKLWITLILHVYIVCKLLYFSNITDVF